MLATNTLELRAISACGGHWLFRSLRFMKPLHFKQIIGFWQGRGTAFCNKLYSWKSNGNCKIFAGNLVTPLLVGWLADFGYKELRALARACLVGLQIQNI